MRIKNRKEESPVLCSLGVPPYHVLIMKLHLLDTLLALSSISCAPPGSPLTCSPAAKVSAIYSFLPFLNRYILEDLAFRPAVPLPQLQVLHQDHFFVISPTSHIQALKSISTLHTYVSSLLIFQQHYTAAKLPVSC